MSYELHKEWRPETGDVWIVTTETQHPLRFFVGPQAYERAHAFLADLEAQPAARQELTRTADAKVRSLEAHAAREDSSDRSRKRYNAKRRAQYRSRRGLREEGAA